MSHLVETIAEHFDAVYETKLSQRIEKLEGQYKELYLQDRFHFNKLAGFVQRFDILEHENKRLWEHLQRHQYHDLRLELIVANAPNSDEALTEIKAELAELRLDVINNTPGVRKEQAEPYDEPRVAYDGSPTAGLGWGKQPEPCCKPKQPHDKHGKPHYKINHQVYGMMDVLYIRDNIVVVENDVTRLAFPLGYCELLPEPTCGCCGLPKSRCMCAPCSTQRSEPEPAPETVHVCTRHETCVNKGNDGSLEYRHGEVVNWWHDGAYHKAKLVDQGVLAYCTVETEDGKRHCANSQYFERIKQPDPAPVAEDRVQLQCLMCDHIQRTNELKYPWICEACGRTIYGPG